MPTPIDDWIAMTYLRERAYRAYVLGLDRNRDRSLIDIYLDLGERFPKGLRIHASNKCSALCISAQAVFETLVHRLNAEFGKDSAANKE